MGVDFSWGGSSSYPRYYEEVEKNCDAVLRCRSQFAVC